jgi:hypothetical protein
VAQSGVLHRLVWRPAARGPHPHHQLGGDCTKSWRRLHQILKPLSPDAFCWLSCHGGFDEGTHQMLEEQTFIGESGSGHKIQGQLTTLFILSTTKTVRAPKRVNHYGVS